MVYINQDNKLINNAGEVAVVYSPEYGAGWSTWNEVSPTDGRYAELIYKGNLEAAKSLAQQEGHYEGGLDDAKVMWLPPNTRFRIDEYDGFERVVLLDPDEYYIT